MQGTRTGCAILRHGHLFVRVSLFRIPGVCCWCRARTLEVPPSRESRLGRVSSGAALSFLARAVGAVRCPVSQCQRLGSLLLTPCSLLLALAAKHPPTTPSTHPKPSPSTRMLTSTPTSFAASPSHPLRLRLRSDPTHQRPFSPSGSPSAPRTLPSTTPLPHSQTRQHRNRAGVS